MITGKADWEEVRPLIEKETGPIHHVTEISGGRNSEISVIVHAKDSTFVKGRKSDHPQAWTQERERAINPVVRHVAPALKWSALSDEWDLLGFEYLPGFKVDYSPGSPDLAAVVSTMLDLQGTSCPDGVEVKHAEQRWAAYTDKPGLLAGGALLHTDWSPGNVLISDRAYLVDWAWPTRGAAWIDPACWLVWLIACGHSAVSAEQWAGRIPSFRGAPASVLDEFARVQGRMWGDIAGDSSEEWKASLAGASRAWAVHRNGGS